MYTDHSQDRPNAKTQNIYKFKTLEMILTTFAEHNALKVEINHKKKRGEGFYSWKLNNLITEEKGNKKQMRMKTAQ